MTKRESTMTDARGNQVPTRYVPAHDKKRDRLVRKFSKRAHKLNADLHKFKEDLLVESASFVEDLEAQHNIHRGGKKGNLTLTSFDSSLRILIAQHDTIAFNEQLQLAQELLNQWMRSKINGIDADLQTLIDDAFYASGGSIRTSRILSLLRLNIKDAKWKQAMKLIKESITVASSKEYIRFLHKE